MKRLGLAIALVAAMIPAQVSAGRGSILHEQQATCDPTFPGAVTFLVDDFSYPAWYDGGVAVTVARYTGRAVRLEVDRPVEGFILTGTRRQIAYRDTDGGTFRLRGDRILSVMVCYEQLA